MAYFACKWVNWWLQKKDRDTAVFGLQASSQKILIWHEQILTFYEQMALEVSRSSEQYINEKSDLIEKKKKVYVSYQISHLWAVVVFFGAIARRYN